jgi:hypothetical protein
MGASEAGVVGRQKRTQHQEIKAKAELLRPGFLLQAENLLKRHSPLIRDSYVLYN